MSIELLANSSIWPLIERVYDFILYFEVDTGKIIRKYGFDKVCTGLNGYTNYYSLMEQYKKDYINSSSYDEFTKKTDLIYLSNHDYVKFVGLENIEGNLQHWYEYIIVVDDNIGIMLINDIHKAHCRMLELEDASANDYLTGLMNRQTLDKYLNTFVEKNMEFSLIFIDVDDFKSINDNYGHDVGDCVLKELGQILREKLPSSSLISRYGGDEFIAAINPIIEKKAFINCLQSLNEKVKNELICGVKVSISLGVSDYPSNGSSVSAVLKSADKALYCAKLQGKSRYILSE